MTFSELQSLSIPRIFSRLGPVRWLSCGNNRLSHRALPRQFSNASQAASVLGLQGQGTPLETLSEEEQLMKDAASKFARERIQPLVREMDDNKKMDAGLLRGLFENGFMGIEVDQKYGGTGSSFTSTCHVMEEIAKVDMSVATCVDAQNTLVNSYINAFASEEQKEKYSPRLAKDTVGSFGLSEPSSGSDAFALKTTAVKDGEHYVLNGSKMWITNSEHSGIFLIMANADPSKGYRGITCFIVERDTPGLIIGRPEDKLGLHASSTCSLFFENARVHESQILGQVGEGYKYAIHILNEGRIAIAYMMLGVAQGCLNHTLSYVQQREQFGRPIWQFQSLQHQISHMATLIEAAKCLSYNAARRRDSGLSVTKEAAMAKYFAADVCNSITSKCIECMGGVGFSKDYPLEKYYRDCKVGAIYEGTANIQLNTIAKFLKPEDY